MKTLVWAVVILGGGAFFFKQCVAPQSKNAAFSGTWTLTVENSLAGKSESETAEVHTDGKRFRVVRASSDPYYGSSSTLVFDGEKVHEKHVYTPAAQDQLFSAGADDEDGDEGEHASTDASAYANPPAESRAPAPGELTQLMFWKDAVDPQTKTGAGGAIAGRETVLYQARWKRPDGELTGQVWMDAETGTVLKKVASMYSRQVESEVIKHSIECTRFQPGPVDPALFNRP